MSNEVEAQADHIIPRAAARAEQFLGVIRNVAQQERLDLNLQPAKRGGRDASIILRSPLSVGRGNQVALEVFADPQGASLHVGWQATRNVGGGFLNGTGLGKEIQFMRTFGSSKASNERALSGILQAFDGLVFQPVVQQLVDAIQQESGPRTNGFLGA